MDGSTAGAGPCADREGKVLQDVVAVRAAFAARKEPVDDLQLLPVPAALVGQPLAEGMPANVGYPAGQTALHHGADVQVLDAIRVLVADEHIKYSI
jgi:hypothetical protein